MTRLTDEELIELLGRQLPDLLERRPEVEPIVYNAFLKILVRKEEVAAVMAELRDFRVETRTQFNRVNQRFEQVDKHFEQVDDHLVRIDQHFDTLESEMRAGFQELQRAIDRLGSRWGIRNESIFRQTIATLLEQSFKVKVEQRTIAGEQFDILIFNGQHILVEIAASVGPKIQERLQRKRQLYTEATGIVPARIILATASIHSSRAQALRDIGIEVIEPEEETLGGE